MLRVGIIAEGPSEWYVLEGIMKALHPETHFVRIRPDMTPTSSSPYGWRGVKAWCREFGRDLMAYMRGVQGQEIDLLVIHADCSMAHNEDPSPRPCPPASTTADVLRAIIIERWLGLPRQPPYVLVTTPSMSTDAWVVAALEPAYKGLSSIECDGSAEEELVRRKLLRKKKGEVKKQAVLYRPLAVQLVQRLDVVCNHCTQAARFRDEFRTAVATVQSGVWV